MINEKIRKEINKSVEYIRYYSTEHQILDRVPVLEWEEDTGEDRYAIIDLETTGLNSDICKIIEIGVVVFCVNEQKQFTKVIRTYNSLQDPGHQVPDFITKLTGIKTKDVVGKEIDWNYVLETLLDCSGIICHNAKFDKSFLMKDSSEALIELLKLKKFYCSKNNIDWDSHDYRNTKLDYLNWAMGYFYNGHRALDDCWATLNILLQSSTMPELLNNWRIR